MDFFEKDAEKQKWRTIHEVINQGYSNKNKPFEETFLERCKTFANITQNIPKDTKYVIKETALEGGLYHQVFNIRRSKKTVKESEALKPPANKKTKQVSSCL